MKFTLELAHHWALSVLARRRQTGHFTAHHAFMAQLFLDRIDAHTADTDTLSARIETLMEPFLPARELLESIPGFSQRVAEVFIAETGADMSVFPTAWHMLTDCTLLP